MFLTALVLVFIQSVFPEIPVSVRQKGLTALSIRMGDQKSFRAVTGGARGTATTKGEVQKSESRQDFTLWWPYQADDTLFAKGRRSMRETAVETGENWTLSFGRKFRPHLEAHTQYEVLTDTLKTFDVFYGVVKFRADTLARFRFRVIPRPDGFTEALGGGLELPSGRLVTTTFERKEAPSALAAFGYFGPPERFHFVSGSDTLAVLNARWGKMSLSFNPTLESKDVDAMKAFTGLWLMFVRQQGVK